ncbi:nicotinate phosphoribosyltransferase [candidate division KSB1 bacterium]|nr:nicotinate phosphoribosyltransferase [candidate division KSB1 bacterium]
MSQLYFRMGLQEMPARFDHFFREYPDYGVHQAGYCINAGLEWFVDWMTKAKFGKDEVECLRSQKNRVGNRIFQDDFIQWLEKNGTFESLNISAIPEGRAIHPHIPLSSVQGPIIMAQIIETALLNQMNYQTLIATKAARIHYVVGGQLLLEFGTRRAQEKGALAGTRAALIGGADFSSNVGISHALGYPPKGTHAHSMVQLFLTLGMTELEAFRAFSDIYPDDCILLVDTINTLESGVPNAIKVFEELQKKGHKPVGIRLDSGDLAYISIKAAILLNKAGFEDTMIVLSNELDELNIWQIIDQIRTEASDHGIDADKLIKRLAYGVGTNLITSSGCSALGGVYKLVAVKDGNEWKPAMKLSENVEKMPNPGQKKVWRLYDNNGKATADLVGKIDEKPEEENELILHHPAKHTKSRTLSKNEISQIETLSTEIIRQGKVIYDFPSIEEMRKVRQADLESLDAGVKRLINPHFYHISITEKLWNEKHDLLEKLKYGNLNNKNRE